MWTVISLGGSVVVPDSIDTTFLKGFVALIQRLLGAQRFVIITGGGRTARQYQAAARALGDVPDDELDWLGIHATRLNAQLLRAALRVHAALISDPEHDALPDAPVLIGAGWKPGCSTDYDAAVIAERVGAPRIINVSNTSHVYDKDPREFTDARPIERLTWDELLALIGDEWRPGLNAPFDPVAAKRCRAAGISAAIVSADLANLEAALTHKPFVGTIVRP
ncbi:UMP kinase [Candidatus Woesearchaeota archaeon]|nr:MAG: UMP kinase [Candidatus Woesearchaeota archaeon]